MKSYILAAFVLFTFQSQAGYQRCPKNWAQNNAFTYGLLQKMQGIHQVGDCQLEVSLCNANAEPSEDGLVADVLVRQQGQEYYVPLYVEQDTRTSSSNLTSGQREVIFKFLDRNEDPIAGNFEKDRFTMKLNFQKTKIFKVDLIRKNENTFSKFIFWKLPKRLHCIEKQSKWNQK